MSSPNPMRSSIDLIILACTLALLSVVHRTSSSPRKSFLLILYCSCLSTLQRSSRWLAHVAESDLFKIDVIVETWRIIGNSKIGRMDGVVSRVEVEGRWSSTCGRPIGSASDDHDNSTNFKFFYPIGPEKRSRGWIVM
jgi:hypothetical protein